VRKIFFAVFSLLLIGGIIGYFYLVDSSSQYKPYGSEEAIKKGDIVFKDKVYNIKRFEQFLTNLANRKKDSIRITGYTDEGDPLFKDLRFDGKVILYSYDDSNDAFGGNNKGLKKDVCKEVLEKVSIQGEINYIMSGCSKNSQDMSYFLIRVPKK